MNRDNVLWALVGLMIGFVAAYIVFEQVGAQQPARVPFDQTAADAGAPVNPGQPNPGQPGVGQAPDVAQLQQRVRQVEQFLEQNPDDADAWLQLANLSFDLQDWPRAVRGYEAYLERAEPSPDVLSDYGVSLHRVGRSQEALALFDRAQQLQPDHWQSYFNEAVVLAFGLGSFDRAAEVVAQLQELQPDNPDVQRLAAEIEDRRDAA